MTTILEEDLARLVVSWLASQGWDVYQEVQVSAYGHRADIVARNGRLLWVVEVKKSFSLALLDQARRWLGEAHFVSVAHAQRSRARGMALEEKILRWMGIGAITVDAPLVYQRLAPRLNRRIAGRLAEGLVDQQKTWAPAGNARGQYWTPYQETCRHVLQRVKEQPGLSMRELVDGLAHHYSCDVTARSALLQWIHRGEVPGVEARREGRRIVLYPAAVPEPETEGGLK